MCMLWQDNPRRHTVLYGVCGDNEKRKRGAGGMTPQDRKKQMETLFKNGMTYAEIGCQFGISRQRVAQIIGKRNEKYFRAIKCERCVYVGVRKWLIDNKISITELTRRLYGNSSSDNFHSVNNRLNGSAELTKTYIDKILKITGLTYEEAFKKE